MQVQESDPQSIRFLKSLLYVGLFVTTVFVIVYTVLGKGFLAVIVFGIWAAYVVSLWFVHHNRHVGSVLHFAIGSSVIGMILSASQAPVTAYWLPIVAIAAFVLLQKRGTPWALLLFFGTALLLGADAVRAHPLYTLDERLNILFDYVAVVITCYMFLMRVENKQREITEYAGRLAAEKVEREKLELARTLAGGIAHLVNNEMQAIVSKSYLLKQRLPASDSTDVDLLQASAMRASGHINQLLAYAEGSRLPRQRVDMRTLLREVVGAWQKRLPPHILLRAKLGKDSPVCDGDREELRQVLDGLLENAMEACGDDGSITLSMKRRHLDRGDRRLDLEGDYVRIMVRDNGHGMSGEVMGHIFEPFYSTRFAGRGLGLSAIFGIVNYHHGRITVESEVGKGSTFTIWWPLSVEPEMAAIGE